MRQHTLTHQQQIGQYEDMAAFLRDLDTGSTWCKLHEDIRRCMQLASILERRRRDLKLDLLLPDSSVTTVYRSLAAASPGPEPGFEDMELDLEEGGRVEQEDKAGEK